MKKNSLIGIVVVVLLLLTILLGFCIRNAPIFSHCLIAVFVISFGFISTEGMMTHNAKEFENRFWSFMAFLMACSCFFAPDSPFRLQSDRFGLAFVVIIGFTYVVHIVDRYLNRFVFNKVPNIIKHVTSSDFSNENRFTAKQQLSLLKRHLDVIDQKWVSSSFLNIFLISTVLKIEGSIISVFEEANTDQLNLIIPSVECKLGLIFYKVKDHKIWRQYNRTKLLELLAVTKLNELKVVSRAMLLHALQQMNVAAHPKGEQYVKHIICSTRGDDLSRLKSLTDSKGDVNSMHKLIYIDIRTPAVRDEILKHIAMQARFQGNLLGNLGRQRGRLAWRKILSDVDDTLLCSGGSWPAGVDTSFPKKALYPGCMAFYRELDLGTSGDNEWDESKCGNLVLLSARPHVYKGVSEDVTYDKFQKIKDNRGLYTTPSMLAGSLKTGAEYIITGDYEPLAKTKTENFIEYLKLYPEFTTIFIGDNGQGDVRTAEMVKDTEFKNNLHRVYIHAVIPIKDTHAVQAATKSNNSPYICYFETYIDAAIDAFQHQLIRLSGLRRILLESVRDFEYIPMDAWRREEHHSVDVEKEIQDRERKVKEKKVAKANAAAAGAGVGAVAVSAAGGPGLAGGNDVKDVKGDGSAASKKTTNTNASSKPRPKRRVHPPHHLLSKEVKRDVRMREINAALTRANAILVAGHVAPVKLLKFPPKYKRGTGVRTPYGKGVVEWFRPSDGMYSVLLQWDSSGDAPPVKACLLQSSIAPLPAPAAGALSLTSSLPSTSFVSRIMGHNVGPPAVTSVAFTTPACLSKMKDVHVSSASSTSLPSGSGTTGGHVAVASTTSTSAMGGGVDLVLSPVRSMLKPLTSKPTPITPSVSVAVAAQVPQVAPTAGPQSSGKPLDAPLKAGVADMEPKSGGLESPSPQPARPSPLLTPVGSIADAVNRPLVSPRTKLATLEAVGGKLAPASSRPSRPPSTTSSSSSTSLSHEQQRLASVRGARAWTPFGIGTIMDHRPADDMMVIIFGPIGLGALMHHMNSATGVASAASSHDGSTGVINGGQDKQEGEGGRGRSTSSGDVAADGNGDEERVNEEEAGVVDVRAAMRLMGQHRAVGYVRRDQVVQLTDPALTLSYGRMLLEEQRRAERLSALHQQQQQDLQRQQLEQSRHVRGASETTSPDGEQTELTVEAVQDAATGVVIEDSGFVVMSSEGGAGVPAAATTVAASSSRTAGATPGRGGFSWLTWGSTGSTSTSSASAGATSGTIAASPADVPNSMADTSDVTAADGEAKPDVSQLAAIGAHSQNNVEFAVDQEADLPASLEDREEMTLGGGLGVLDHGTGGEAPGVLVTSVASTQRARVDESVPERAKVDESVPERAQVDELVPERAQVDESVPECAQFDESVPERA